MRFGVVIHGAEVIDSGTAARALDALGERGEVIATLGGAMGATAVLDAGLEDRVAIVPGQLVSDALLDLASGCDALLLLNHAKSRASGLALGGMVARKVSSRIRVPMVHLDDGFFVVWSGRPPEGLMKVVRELAPSEASAPALGTADEGTRPVYGVIPGENVWINGTVVGRATSSKVVISSRGGLLSFDGLEIKQHGLGKLGEVDLFRAIIRSGSVRRTSSRPLTAPRGTGTKVILVDHRAESSAFRWEGVRAAVSVGDDTTRITTALLARRGIPVIGITDGDEDGICSDRTAAEGSAALRLRPGNDDQLGALVRREVFRGRDSVEYEGTLDDLIGSIKELAGDKLLSVERKEV